MENFIQVSAADNQVILYAYQFEKSYEICNIQSGHGADVAVQIQLAAGEYTQPAPIYGGAGGPIQSYSTVCLPAGDYELFGIGISWGGPKSFEFSLDSTGFIIKPQTGDFNGVQMTTGSLPFTIS
jgi:hypothetical protein